MPIAGVDQMQWVSGARPVVQNSPQLASCQMRRGHEAKRLPYPHPGQQCAQVSRALIHGNNRLTLDSQALVAAMEVEREWLRRSHSTFDDRVRRGRPAPNENCQDGPIKPVCARSSRRRIIILVQVSAPTFGPAPHL
jgi:hypothetical protein